MIKELRLEVNKHCNYDCVHCYTDKHEYDWLPMSRIKALLAETKQGGGTDVSLTGGEPLIDWRHVLEIAKEARGHNLTVRLNTNGHLLTDEVVTELTPWIQEFQVSLNGADAEFFDWFVRRKGAFAKVIAGIQRLTAAGAYVTVRFTLMKETAPQLVKTFQLCDELGVQFFKVRAVVPAGQIAPQTSAEAIGVMRRASEEFFEVASRSKMEVRFNDGGAGISVPATASNITFMACLCGSDALFVGADGKVAPCVFLRDYDKFQLGDARHEGLDSIYDSPRLKDFIGEKAEGCGNERADGCRAADLCTEEGKAEDEKRGVKQRLRVIEQH